jgi:hypothetical protein
MSDTTTMTIKLINQPGSTGRGSIVGTDDQRLGVFPEKVGLFEVGKTYEIEYTETDRRRQPQGQPAANGQGNGNGHYRETSDKDAERMWVCATLTALIRAGEVKNDKRQLWETTNMLRALWSHSFGNGGTFQASEAGRLRLVAAE